MGKLRGYKAGTEYNLFDKGDNPEITQIPEYLRNQLAGIKYVSVKIILDTERRK